VQLKVCPHPPAPFSYGRRGADLGLSPSSSSGEGSLGKLHIAWLMKTVEANPPIELPLGYKPPKELANFIIN